jgi:hypothetical protein
VNNIYINGDNNVVVVNSGQSRRFDGYRSLRSNVNDDADAFALLICAGVALVFVIIFIANSLFGAAVLLSAWCGVVGLVKARQLEMQARRRAYYAARRQEAAALMARADDQNAAYLQGDSRGMYGDYQPEKL